MKTNRNIKQYSRIFILFSLLAGLFFMSFWGITSCNKEKSEIDEVPIGQDSIVPLLGTVELPSNSSKSLSGWNVNSGFLSSQLKGNKYTLDEASSDFGLLFLSDENDEPQLMRLVYSGQTDQKINCSSTVLAMLMKMPIVNSLSSEGQLKLIQDIQANPLFGEAVSEFEIAFQQNKPLFDTTNITFHSKLRSIFETSILKSQKMNNPHVTIYTVGRNLVIQNPGYAISHYVGIYKNNERITSFALDPYQYFFGDISEFLSSFIDSPTVIEKIYPMKGDGDFEIRVRTGNILSGINDYENRSAFQQNITNIALANIGFVVRNIPFFNLNNECVKEIRATTAESVLEYSSYLSQPNSSISVIDIITKVTNTTIDLIKVSKKCIKSPAEYSFLGKVGQFLKWANLVSKVGGVLNQSNSLRDWAIAPAAFDTCFQAYGSIVSRCETYKVALPDGEIVTSKLNFENKVERELKLVNEDGSEATDINYNQISISGNTNSLVTVSKTTLVTATSGFGIKLTFDAQTFEQTTSFDVLYQSKKVQTINASVNDSTELYRLSAIGKYQVTASKGSVGNSPEAELYCELKADGQCFYSIYKDTLHWPDGYTWYTFWTIIKKNGRYYYRESGGNWFSYWISYVQPLTYPVTQMNIPYGDVATYTFTKQ